MRYFAEIDGRLHEVELREHEDPPVLVIDGSVVPVDWQRVGELGYSILLDHRSLSARVSGRAGHYEVSVEGEHFTVRIGTGRSRIAGGLDGSGDGRAEIRAIMPGRVVEVLVDRDAAVEPNQPVLIIEAMKMENEIKTPVRGQVKSIHVERGQTVKTNDLLIVIA